MRFDFREMFNFIKSVMKTIFFKLYMNFIGAVYMFKENTYQRPRRLPDYGQLGEANRFIGKYSHRDLDHYLDCQREGSWW